MVVIAAYCFKVQVSYDFEIYLTDHINHIIVSLYVKGDSERLGPVCSIHSLCDQSVLACIYYCFWAQPYGIFLREYQPWDTVSVIVAQGCT